MLSEQVTVAQTPTVTPILAIPWRVSGVVLTNTGATALTVFDGPTEASGLALPAGATLTFPNSTAGTITAYASSTGGTGQVTYFLPD